jgi:hypothetical protein
MEIPLRRKYRVYKPTKKTRAAGDHQGVSKRRKLGPKTYVPRDHVMVMWPSGKLRMLAREDVPYEG